MANDLNQCNFIGRLGKDPEIKYLASGKAVCNASIAIGSTWKDKNTGEKQENTEWVNIVAFGRLAEVFGEYLHKGDQIFVSGKMRTQSWEDKNVGVKRYKAEILVDSMQMLNTKRSGGGGAQQSSGNNQQNSSYRSGQQNTGNQRQENFDDDFDDDIPF